MKILVTGGGGVLGYRTLQILLTHSFNVEIHALTRSKNSILKKLAVQYRNLNVIVHDLMDQKPLRLAKVDVLIHMASDSSVGPSLKPNEIICRSMLLSQAVAKIASESRIKKLIYISSGAVYDARDAGCLCESAATLSGDAYSNAYGYGKFFAERLFEICAQDFCFEYICFRLFSVYGPRSLQVNHYALSNMINSALSKKLIVVKEPDARRTYLHESDFSRLIEFATVEKMKYSLYNIGGDQCYTMLELANMISMVTGAGVSIGTPTKFKSRRFNYIPDTQRINEEFLLNSEDFMANITRLILQQGKGKELTHRNLQNIDLV